MTGPSILQTWFRVVHFTLSQADSVRRVSSTLRVLAERKIKSTDLFSLSDRMKTIEVFFNDYIVREVLVAPELVTFSPARQNSRIIRKRFRSAIPLCCH